MEEKIIADNVPFSKLISLTGRSAELSDGELVCLVQGPPNLV
jgi:hypothetical protein